MAGDKRSKKHGRESDRTDQAQRTYTPLKNQPSACKTLFNQRSEDEESASKKTSRPSLTRSHAPAPEDNDLPETLASPLASRASDDAGSHVFQVVMKTTDNLRKWARTQSSKGNISKEAKEKLEENRMVVVQATGEFRAAYDRAEGRRTGAELAVEKLATTITHGFNLLSQEATARRPIQEAHARPNAAPPRSQGRTSTGSNSHPQSPSNAVSDRQSDNASVVFVRAKEGSGYTTATISKIIDDISDPISAGIQVLSRRSAGPAGIRIALSTTGDRDIIAKKLRTRTATWTFRSK